MKNIIRSVKHLNFIRSLPCYISEQEPSQACHIRILSDGGTGLKPSDYLTLPFTLAKELVIISPCKKVNNEVVIKQLEERAKTYARIYKDQ